MDQSGRPQNTGKRALAALLFFSVVTANVVADQPRGDSYRLMSAGEMERQRGQAALDKVMPKIEQIGGLCSKFFDWHTRYFVEYGKDPRTLKDFPEQIKVFKDRQDAALPFLKLFLPEEASKFFGEDAKEGKYQLSNEAQEELLACLSRVASTESTEVLDSYKSFLGFVKRYIRRNPGKRHLQEALAKIEDARISSKELLKSAEEARGGTDRGQLDSLKSQGKLTAALMWPSETEAFTNAFAQRSGEHLPDGLVNTAGRELTFVEANAPESIKELLSEARGSGRACANFFDWLSRYFVEYGVNPRSDQDFDEQISEFSKTNDAALPFLKLFLPVESAKLFGQPVTEVDVASRQNDLERQLEHVCFRPMFGNERNATGTLGATKYWLSYKPLLKFARYSGSNEKLQKALRRIQEAYSRKEGLLAGLKNPGNEFFTFELENAKKEGAATAELLWPSEKKIFMEQFGPVVAEAGLVAERNDLNKRQSQMSRCENELSHPDDPGKLDAVPGRTDEELLADFDSSLVQDCAVALHASPTDAQVLFRMGRAYLFAGDNERARQFYEEAAEVGSAPAPAYLGDWEQYTDVALDYYRQAALRGFKPAEEAEFLLAEYVVEIERIEAEEFADAERLVGNCDRLASHPDDRGKPAEIDGVEDSEIKFEEAFDACASALERAPEHLRTVFHLGRVLSLVEELKEDAFSYLQAAHKAGYAPATYYLSRFSGRREQEQLLTQSANGGFGRAKQELSQLIRYPRSLGVTDIFVDPANLLSAGNSPNALKPQSYSVSECVNEIVAAVRDDKIFRSGLSEVLASGALSVCMMSAYDPRYCDLWNKMQEAARAEAKELCEREERLFRQDFPNCFAPYWPEQHADALKSTTDSGKNIARSVIAAFHSLPGSIEQKLEGFDELAGEITDLAAILYFEENGMDLHSIAPTDLNERHMLKNAVDPELRSLVAEGKSSNKYEIVLNMFPPGVICEL